MNRKLLILLMVRGNRLNFFFERKNLNEKTFKRLLFVVVCLLLKKPENIDLILGRLKCGPIECLLNEAHMCFTTSKFSTDNNGVSFITECGTCLSINGMVLTDKTLNSELLNKKTCFAVGKVPSSEKIVLQNQPG